MRWIMVVMMVGLWMGATAGGEEVRDAQVEAARENALDALYEEVMGVRLNGESRVGDLVVGSEAKGILRAGLDEAQLIGGARWGNAQTCQVKLELSGRRVVEALDQVLEAYGEESPVEAGILGAWEGRKEGLTERIFAATGSSSGAAVVAYLRPPAGAEAWLAVPDAARVQALEVARRNAVEQVMESLRPIRLTETTTLGEALDEPEYYDRLHSWLQARPVRRVEFRNDLQVELTLAVPAERLSAELREALSQVDGLPLAEEEINWDRVAERISEGMAAPVGYGRVAPEDLDDGTPSVNLPQNGPATVELDVRDLPNVR